MFSLLRAADPGGGGEGGGAGNGLFYHHPYHQPLKKREKLNQIGLALGQETGVPYLVSDFKKKDGYRRSIQLSGEYGLYGSRITAACVFSRKEAEEREKRAAARNQ